MFCPNCRRILYIPEDLPPEAAVNKKKIPKPKKVPEIGAATPRQESAVDVRNSMVPDESEVPDTTQSAAESESPAHHQG